MLAQMRSVSSGDRCDLVDDSRCNFCCVSRRYAAFNAKKRCSEHEAPRAEITVARALRLAQQPFRRYITLALCELTLAIRAVPRGAPRRAVLPSHTWTGPNCFLPPPKSIVCRDAIEQNA